MKSSEELSEVEYNIYTEIYKTKVFDFDSLKIVVNDYTGLHPTYIAMDKSRWSAPFIGKCKYLCARQPEILIDFTCKNEESYKLEKKILSSKRIPIYF